MSDRLHTIKLVLAFLVVYTVWGSTYLGIKIGVEDLPPGLLAGVRFLLAGLILFVPAMALGQRLPATRSDWVSATIMGALMVLAGNGFVTWAEQWVESNQAALIITTGALWLAFLGQFGPRGESLDRMTITGLLIGFAGAVMILWPREGIQLDYVWAQFAIMAASLCWVIGTLYSRSQTINTPPLMYAAVQMFLGGAMLTAVGLAAGEGADWTWTARGIGALLYLTIFGSCLAYATYIWLINHTTAARLGTIAYINPVIAVLLGWWILDEEITGIRFAGMFVILVGVVLVSLPKRRTPRYSERRP